MMADREKLIKILDVVGSCNAEYCCDCEFAEDIEGCVRRQKEIIADHLISNGVTVRERGRWEKIAHYPYYCSICGEIAPLDFEGESHYKSDFCPVCGADMRGAEDGT